MLSTLIGAIINVTLDPIAIFVFHMGMRGEQLWQRSPTDRICIVSSILYQTYAFCQAGKEELFTKAGRNH
jgi:hypothetical protein